MPLDHYSEIEEKIKKIKEAREIEQALEHCKFGILNRAMIYKIAAEDAGEAERSVTLNFTPEESAAIFVTISKEIKPRLEKLRAELGL